MDSRDEEKHVLLANVNSENGYNTEQQITSMQALYDYYYLINGRNRTKASLPSILVPMYEFK